MKVTINRGTADLNETIVETVDASNEVQKTNQEKVALLKPNAFTLFDLFQQRFYYANIDGEIHLFDRQKGYYYPVDQRDLEELLLNHFYDVIRASGSTRIAKSCAELILKLKRPAVVSAEKQMMLCFKTGYLPITVIENTFFCNYETSMQVFPTYLINATGCSNLNDWANAKLLGIPCMDTYLSRISNGNRVIQERIWQMIGYLLTPDMNGKCFFILQGVPNSGKSVLGSFIGQLLSEHRIASLDIDQLGKKNATSLLVNKSINISMDLPNKTLSPLAIRNIKLMTGNDDITIEYPNGKMERYRGNCKFLFATNHALTLKGTDSGFEERIVCIPFNYAIPETQRNRNLLNCLLLEKDAIVAKAIAHYRDLRFANYRFAGSELDACKIKTRYLPTDAEDIDASLCQFVEERCEFVSQEHGLYTEELYAAYCGFCKEKGETPIDNIAAFSRRVMRCYGNQITKKKWRRGDGENRWGFRGLAIHPMIPVN